MTQSRNMVTNVSFLTNQKDPVENKTNLDNNLLSLLTCDEALWVIGHHWWKPWPALIFWELNDFGMRSRLSLTWTSSDVHALQVFGLQDHHSQFAGSGNVTQREADLPEVFLLRHTDERIHTETFTAKIIKELSENKTSDSSTMVLFWCWKSLYLNVLFNIPDFICTKILHVYKELP